MKINRGRLLGKALMTVALALFTIFIIKVCPVHAETRETVTVNNSKQLKAAMKNPEVGTIILNTEAYINITIKNVKGAEDKALTIMAPNASINNKAVFDQIDIVSVGRYKENVSGNNIFLGGYMMDFSSIEVAKKKKVKSLSFYLDGISYPKYTLRKGAKIENINIINLGYNGGVEEPTDLNFDPDKRQYTLDIVNQSDCYEKYDIKIDNRGNVTSATCESDGVEFAYDYSYKYDSNGKIKKITGHDNENGNFTIVFKYSGNLLTEYDFNSSSFTLSDNIKYTYDEKGNIILSEYHHTDSIDGQLLKDNSVTEYRYDSKNRITYEKRIYNSGLYYEYIYKYNKAGERIETETNTGMDTGKES